MEGYDTDRTSVTTDPEVVEDKVVIGWDDDAEGWVVTRTRVAQVTTTTTERNVRTTAEVTYVQALARAKDEHNLPVYLRSDDRDRAQAEVDDDAHDQAVDAAVRAQDVSAEAARVRTARG